MRAGSEIALLMDSIATNTNKLVGMCLRDAMIHHHHTSTQGFTLLLAVHMVQHRYYALIIPYHVG